MTDERRVIDRIKSHGVEVALQLNEADRSYELLYNGSVFRSTRDSVLCQALSDTIFGLIKSSRAIDILLGGFGMGQTLEAVLSHPELRSVTVVEPDDVLTRWGRKHLEVGPSLDDDRANVVIGNFVQFVDAAPASYHGIGLELDLGPTRVLKEENRRAYAMSTLSALATRLRSDGVLVIRSAEEDSAYRRALEEIFSEVGVRRVDETNTKGNSVEGVFYVARM